MRKGKRAAPSPTYDRRDRWSSRWSFRLEPRRSEEQTTPLCDPLPCRLIAQSNPRTSPSADQSYILCTRYARVRFTNREHHASLTNEAIRPFLKARKGQVPERENEPLPLAGAEGNSCRVPFCQETKNLGHSELAYPRGTSHDAHRSRLFSSRRSELPLYHLCCFFL
jgi:hypothetical protein